MSKYSLTVESDNPYKMQCLVALAHILFEGHVNEQPPFAFLKEVAFFLDMFSEYLDNVEMDRDEVESLNLLTGDLEELTSDIHKMVKDYIETFLNEMVAAEK